MKQLFWHCRKPTLCQAMDEDLDEPCPKKRRKGGQQQRLESIRRAESNTASTDQPSLLAEWLKEQWAWGKFSPQTVQHVASLATKDMVAAGATNIPASLHKLSLLGSSGAYANNCHRDLMALVAGVSKLPPPLQLVVPLKVKGSKALQSVMLPHLVMHHVWKHYQDYWKKFFLPSGTAGLVDFWQKYQHHPSMDGHWLKSQSNWMASTVPLNIHGDAVPTVGCGKVWSKLMQCYSWAGLLSVGSTKEKSFFIYGAARTQPKDCVGQGL